MIRLIYHVLKLTSKILHVSFLLSKVSINIISKCDTENKVILWFGILTNEYVSEMQVINSGYRCNSIIKHLNTKRQNSTDHNIFNLKVCLQLM